MRSPSRNPSPTVTVSGGCLRFSRTCASGPSSRRRRRGCPSSRSIRIPCARWFCTTDADWPESSQRLLREGSTYTILWLPERSVLTFARLIVLGNTHPVIIPPGRRPIAPRNDSYQDARESVVRASAISARVDDASRASVFAAERVISWVWMAMMLRVRSSLSRKPGRT